MRLLIVDDERAVCAGTARRIAGMGFPEIGETVCAYSGEEALERLRAERFDAMFTDIRMGEMDGLELVRRARALDPALICVIITAFDQFQYAQQAIRLGVEDYVVKPVSLDTMRRQVRVVIDKRLGMIARRDAQLELEICAQMLSGERDLDACFALCGLTPPGGEAVVVRWEALPEDAEWALPAGVWRMRPREHHFLITLWRGGETRACVEENARRMGAWVGVSRPGKDLKRLSEEAAEALGFCWQMTAPGASFWTPQAQRGLSLNSPELLSALQALNAESAVALLRDTLAGYGEDCRRAARALTEALAGEALELQAGLDLPPSPPLTLRPGLGVEGALDWLRVALARARDAAARPDPLHPVSYAIRYARAHLCEPVDMAVVANRLNMSYAYFSRIFRERTGTTFSRYLLELRMREACRLLMQGEKLVDIAARLGYQNAANLTRSFTREMGVSPSRWLEEHGGDGA